MVHGLERVKLRHSIALDDAETERPPCQPQPARNAGGQQEKDPLDQIIHSFSERWLKGWGVTTKAKRVQLLSTLKGILEHPDFAPKYQ